MEETKSLCAKIPIELHNRIRTSQEESRLTLNQYVEKLLIEYYQMKGETAWPKQGHLQYLFLKELHKKAKL